MRKRDGIAGLCVFALLALSCSASWAGRAERVCGVFGGGELPVPFPGVKMELADNETYTLSGALVQSASGLSHGPGQLYFQVDFQAQPWLANSKRIESPYYPLDNSAEWMQYAGELVQVVAVAHGEVTLDPGQALPDYNYTIRLHLRKASPLTSSCNR